MIQKTLAVGTFRGKEYHFETLSKSSGRKSVIHTFPNSDGAISEDFGKSAERFTMNIFVHGIGVEYRRQRNRLIFALEKKGAGALVHPTFGFLKVQVEGNYSLTETIREMGKAKFTVTFVKVKNKITEKEPEQRTVIPFNFSTEASAIAVKEAQRKAEQDRRFNQFTPPDPSNDLNKVKDKSNSVKEKTKQSFLDKVKSTFSESASNVLANVQDTQAALSRASAFMQQSADYSTLKKLIGDLGFSSATQIFDIVDGIIDVMELADNIAQNEEIKYQFFRNLFDFNDDKFVAPTTKAKQESSNNNIAFRDIMQNVALGFACNVSASIDYDTEDEINLRSEQLNDQINKVTENQRDNSELYKDVQQLKVALNSQFTKSRIDAFRVIDIQVVNSSLTTVCHQYYGNLDNYDTILSLNDFNNPTFINGTIKIITNV